MPWLNTDKIMSKNTTDPMDFLLSLKDALDKKTELHLSAYAYRPSTALLQVGTPGNYRCGYISVKDLRRLGQAALQLAEMMAPSPPPSAKPINKAEFEIWAMPMDAAATLYETLSMDCESKNFDPELREDISDAMAQIKVYYTKTKPSWPTLKL